MELKRKVTVFNDKFYYLFYFSLRIFYLVTFPNIGMHFERSSINKIWVPKYIFVSYLSNPSILQITLSKCRCVYVLIYVSLRRLYLVTFYNWCMLLPKMKMCPWLMSTYWIRPMVIFLVSPHDLVRCRPKPRPFLIKQANTGLGVTYIINMPAFFSQPQHQEEGRKWQR